LLELLLADRPPERSNLFRSAPTPTLNQKRNGGSNVSPLLSRKSPMIDDDVQSASSIIDEGLNDHTEKDEDEEHEEDDNDNDNDNEEDDDQVGALASSSRLNVLSQSVLSIDSMKSISNSTSSQRRKNTQMQTKETKKTPLSREGAFAMATSNSSVTFSEGGKRRMKVTVDSSKSSVSSTSSLSKSIIRVPRPLLHLSSSSSSSSLREDDYNGSSSSSSSVIWRHESQILTLIASASSVHLNLYHANKICTTFGFFKGAIAAICAEINQEMQFDILNNLISWPLSSSSKEEEEEDRVTEGTTIYRRQEGLHTKSTLQWQRIVQSAFDVSSICIHLDSQELFNELLTVCVLRIDLLHALLTSAYDAISVRSNADIFEQQQQQQGTNSSASTGLSIPPPSTTAASSIPQYEYRLVEDAFPALIVSAVIKSESVRKAALTVLHLHSLGSKLFSKSEEEIRAKVEIFAKCY